MDKEKVTEYVCDKLCKYAAMKGKTQQWLDKICEHCEMEKLVEDIPAV